MIRIVLALCAALAIAVLPLFVNEYLVHVLTIVCYYVILAASWNMLAGYTGQFSLAQQAFAAIGAYTTGLLAFYWHVPAPLGIAAATVVAGAVGAGLGLLVLRMRAIYLAIATWAFAETLHIALASGYEFTRGELGLSVPSLYGTLAPARYYYTFVLLAAVCLFIYWLVIRSPIGFFMRAVKDDELRAKSLGVNTTAVKTFVFALTSAITGLAGAFYAHYVAVLSPQMADFNEMGKVIIMVIMGGLGTFIAPLVGAPLVQLVLQWLHRFGEWDMVFFAALVIIVMRTSTGGIVELIKRLRPSRAPL